MSDGAAILTCSEYFLNCPGLRLTGAREAKGVKSDWAAISIRSIFAKSALIWGVFTEAVSMGGIFVWDTYESARLSDIGSWSSIK